MGTETTRDAGPGGTRVPWGDPAVVLATCGWVGRIPWAPGTFGTAVGIALAAGLPRAAAALGLVGPWSGVAFEGAVSLGLAAAGVAICGAAARRMGRGGDPGAIVWDEMASVPLGMLAVPAEARGVAVYAAAFLLHRVFDIAKPFPCRQLERLPGGLGIMADDVAAAAWMALGLRLLLLAGLPAP
jgi:phosphatidylglycerophosphatase A